MKIGMYITCAIALSSADSCAMESDWRVATRSRKSEQVPVAQSLKYATPKQIAPYLVAPFPVGKSWADIQEEEDLFKALENGKTMEVMQLLKLGVGVNARNLQEQTPLHVASLQGLAGFVGMLLLKGAKVDLQDENGDTPLHLAVLCGRYEVADLLCSAGASEVIQNKQGRVPRDLEE